MNDTNRFTSFQLNDTDTTTATGIPERSPLDERLDALLDAWELARERGEEFDVERVCADEPQLAAALRRAIDDLQRFDALDEATASIGEDQPTRIGPFRVERRVAQGGTSIVYLCQQHFPRRQVAVKLLRPESVSVRQLRRFRVEAELLASLSHPGIVGILDAGIVNLGFGRQPYLAMEYLHGQRLDEYLNQLTVQGAPRVDEILRLFLLIAEALSFAHQHGIVHRDLKPSNILVDESGQPKLIDFGIARLCVPAGEDADRTATRSMRGTPPYMSPEQFQEQPGLIDVRSDVYSLAVVLYKMLTGRLPYDAENKSLAETARVICEAPAASLRRHGKFSRDLDVVLQKALAKDPRERYRSVAEFADDLRRVLNRRPVAAVPIGPLRQLAMWGRRNPGTAVVSGVVAILLAASAIFSTYVASIASRRADDLRTTVDELRGERQVNADLSLSLQEQNDALQNANRQLTASTESARRTAMNATLFRAGMALESDPTLSRALIFDEAICPPDQRGYAWQLIEQHTRGRLLEFQVTRAPLSQIVTSEFAADGELLVTISPQFLKWWNARDGQPINSLQEGIGPDTKLAVDRRSDLAVVARDDGVVFVTRPGIEKPPRIRHATDPRTTALACADGGHAIALGDELGNVEIRDEPFDSPGRSWKIGEAPIVALAFDEAGQRCAAIDKLGAIVLVDVRDTRELAREQLSLSPLLAAEFSRDLEYVAARSRDDILFWNRPEARAVVTERGPHDLAIAEGNPPALVVAVRNHIHRIDADGRRTLLHVGDLNPYSMAVSPYGLRVAIGYEDGSLWINQAVPPVLKETIAPFPTATQTACYCRGGRRLAVAGRREDGQYAVQVHDLSSGAVLVELPGFQNRIQDLAFTSDENQLVTCERGGALVLWNLDTGTEIRKFQGTGERAAAFVLAPDGRRLYKGGQRTGAVVIYALDDAQPIAALDAQFGPCRALSVTSDGTALIAAHANGTIARWDLATNTLVWNERCEESAIRHISLSPHGERFAVTPEEGSPHLGRVTPTGIERELTLHIDVSRAATTAFSPDGTTLVTGDQTGRVVLWDVVSGEAQLALDHPHPNIVAVRFSPDGHSLVACGRLGATLWRTEPAP